MKKKVERKKQVVRLTALVLAMAMLVSTQGITSLAATARETVVAVEDIKEAGQAEAGQEKEEQAKAGQAEAGQEKEEQAKAGQAEAGQEKEEQAKAEQGKDEQTREETGTETAQPDSQKKETVTDAENLTDDARGEENPEENRQTEVAQDKKNPEENRQTEVAQDKKNPEENGQTEVAQDKKNPEENGQTEVAQDRKDPEENRQTEVAQDRKDPEENGQTEVAQNKKGTEEDGLAEEGLTESQPGNQAANQPENQAGNQSENKPENQSEEKDDSPETTDFSREDVFSAGDVPQGTPANPVHNCNISDGTKDTTTWSYVYFGSYPQSEVKDEETIAAIEAKITEITGEGSDYQGKRADTGIDVWVNGTKYRRISKSDTNNDRYFGDSEYRYFKWERIKWRVLYNSGTDLFVLADTALDCKCYRDEDNIITWEKSTIRSWLNDSFYQTAFTTEEQNAIVEQTVVNEDNPEYASKGGADTRDKIYLLSIEEVANMDYGFCGEYGTESASRWMEPSRYGHARGVNAYSTMYTGNHANCFWWLRSPGSNSFNISGIGYSGYVSLGGIYGGNNIIGVVPVLHIDLSSKVWSETDDLTSGEGGEGKTFTTLKATKTKTTYIQGENLNLEDLIVEAEYVIHGEKTSQTVQAQSYTTNATAIDMNTPGEKTLTVSYTENDVTKTADIILTVSKKPEEKPGDNPGGNPSDNPGGNPSTNPGGNVGGGSQDNQNQQVKVTKLTIKAPSKKLAAGKKVKLTVKAAPAEATNQAVTWKTSNKKYATIDKNGKLTLKKAGAGKTITVTARSKDGSGVKATIKITIMRDAVKSIKQKAPSKTLKAGKTMTIKTTIKTTGKKVNKKLKWTTSNKTYATVNSKGKVTAKKAGKGKTVTITAKATDGSGKKAKVKIKIQ